MNRKDFIKLSGSGLLTLFLSGCGLSALTNKPETTANANNHIGENKMKIVVITGSPHEIFRFNSAFEDIHPCQGCDHCGMNGPCIQNDAIEQTLMPKLIGADLIVLITPLYYYGMSAQIKTVVDRFYSRTGSLHRKKSILMATAYNSADWTMEALVHHYETLVRYMEWQDIGKVLAIGCGSRPIIERTEFPNQAYQIGYNL